MTREDQIYSWASLLTRWYGQERVLDESPQASKPRHPTKNDQRQLAAFIVDELDGVRLVQK